jgi:hypothetical protein
MPPRLGDRGKLSLAETPRTARLCVVVMAARRIDHRDYGQTTCAQR